LKVEAPIAKPPVWLIAPPLLVADKAPVTVPVPRLREPVEIAVRAPVLSVPRMRELTSPICVAAPVIETVPWKSFWFAKMMSFDPALIVTAPVPELMVVPEDCVKTPPPTTVRVPFPAEPIETFPKTMAFWSRIEIALFPVVLRVTALV
jgi:hypothetical protein